MAADVLEIYLADIRRLFNSMDPAPFRERDLDPNAADYIRRVGRGTARQRPAGARGQAGNAARRRGQRCRGRAVGPRSFPAPGGRDSPQPARLAADRALQPADRHAVPRAASSSLPKSAAQMVQTERYAALIENSLVIGAWVALWRPLEIFLYDWWPIRAEAKLFDRLGAMDVQVLSARQAAAADIDGPRHERRSAGRHCIPWLAVDAFRRTVARRGVVPALDAADAERQAVRPHGWPAGQRRCLLGQSAPAAALLRLRALQPAARAAAALPVGVGAGRRRRGSSLRCFRACRCSPGFVTCSLSFPPGFARNTFATITSLLPGSVPADEADGALVYHCLDDTTPVVEQLWQEERLLAKALVAGRRHG